MAVQTGHVQSVEKAMQLLDCLANAKRPMTLQEIATQVGWAKSTVHGLLSTMRNHSIVEQSGLDGKYRLGVRLFELGSLVSSMWDVPTLARPYLKGLCMQTCQCAHIATLDKGDVLYLDRVDSDNYLRVVAAVGTRLPLHCSAFGKAMLSRMPWSQAKLLLLDKGMPPQTPHTITDLTVMQAELEKARAQGYAIEDGEFRVGMRCLAAPVFDSRGEASYAVGVVGMFRFAGEEHFSSIYPLVVEAAREISCGLGYKPQD